MGGGVECPRKNGVDLKHGGVLESDRGQRSSHASVKTSNAIVGNDIAKDFQSRTRNGLLLPYSKSIKWVAGDYAGDATKSTSDKFSTPTACKEFCCC